MEQAVTAAVHEGGCLCGAIRYGVDADPIRVTICHCRFCQRATGAPYVVEAILPKVSLRLLRGAPSVYEHRSAGSGKLILVHFCQACGTKLYNLFERYPENAGIYAGTFDNPGWFEHSPRNSRHIFIGQARVGTVIPAGFNVFREGAVDNAGEPVRPFVFDAHYLVGDDRELPI